MTIFLKKRKKWRRKIWNDEGIEFLCHPHHNHHHHQCRQIDENDEKILIQFFILENSHFFLSFSLIFKMKYHYVGINLNAIFIIIIIMSCIHCMMITDDDNVFSIHFFRKHTHAHSIQTKTLAKNFHTSETWTKWTSFDFEKKTIIISAQTRRIKIKYNYRFHWDIYKRWKVIMMIIMI